MAIKLEDLMKDELQITNSEIADYYEKNKTSLNKDSINISHILVETEKEAKKIIKEFKKKKEAAEQTLEDHREHVSSILQQAKWQQLRPTWLQGLMINATVWKWSP